MNTSSIKFSLLFAAGISAFAVGCEIDSKDDTAAATDGTADGAADGAADGSADGAADGGEEGGGEEGGEEGGDGGGGGDFSGIFGIRVEDSSGGVLCASTWLTSGAANACDGCEFGFDLSYEPDFDECGYGTGLDEYLSIRVNAGHYPGYTYGSYTFDALFVTYDGYGNYPAGYSYVDGSDWSYDQFAQSGDAYYYIPYGGGTL